MLENTTLKIVKRNGNAFVFTPSEGTRSLRLSCFEGIFIIRVKVLRIGSAIIPSAKYEAPRGIRPRSDGASD